MTLGKKGSFLSNVKLKLCEYVLIIKKELHSNVIDKLNCFNLATLS